MKVTVLTLHPEMVEVPLSSSIVGRAAAAGRVDINVYDIRNHGRGKHRSVDDAPYGGGAGMVMRVDVVSDALEAVRTENAHVVMTSPAGKRFSQADAERLSQCEHLIVLCGHYEGIDARIETLIDEELSLGDFVLTGGEVAAVAFVDAAVRLLPGVLGNAMSSVDESFSDGLLEYPQYTRPRSHDGKDVPDVLLSGNHGRIEAWRREQSRQRTVARRPDLAADMGLDVDEARSGE